MKRRAIRRLCCWLMYQAGLACLWHPLARKNLHSWSPRPVLPPSCPSSCPLLPATTPCGCSPFHHSQQDPQPRCHGPKPSQPPSLLFPQAPDPNCETPHVRDVPGGTVLGSVPWRRRGAISSASHGWAAAGRRGGAAAPAWRQRSAARSPAGTRRCSRWRWRRPRAAGGSTPGRRWPPRTPCARGSSAPRPGRRCRHRGRPAAGKAAASRRRHRAPARWGRRGLFPPARCARRRAPRDAGRGGHGRRGSAWPPRAALSPPRPRWAGWRWPHVSAGAWRICEEMGRLARGGFVGHGLEWEPRGIVGWEAEWVGMGVRTALGSHRGCGTWGFWEGAAEGGEGDPVPCCPLWWWWFGAMSPTCPWPASFRNGHPWPFLSTLTIPNHHYSWMVILTIPDYLNCPWPSSFMNGHPRPSLTTLTTSTHHPTHQGPVILASAGDQTALGVVPTVSYARWVCPRGEGCGMHPEVMRTHRVMVLFMPSVCWLQFHPLAQL